MLNPRLYIEEVLNVALAAFFALCDVTVLGGSRKRLAVLTDGAVLAAFLHEARLGSARQRFAVLANGPYVAGLCVGRADSQRGNYCGKCETFHQNLPFYIFI